MGNRKQTSIALVLAAGMIAAGATVATSMMPAGHPFELFAEANKMTARAQHRLLRDRERVLRGERIAESRWFSENMERFDRFDGSVPSHQMMPPF